MSTILSFALVFTLGLVAVLLAPELGALIRGRHYAGCRRYLRPTTTEPLRRGDTSWLRALGL